MPLGAYIFAIFSEITFFQRRVGIMKSKWNEIKTKKNKRKIWKKDEKIIPLGLKKNNKKSYTPDYVYEVSTFFLL